MTLTYNNLVLYLNRRIIELEETKLPATNSYYDIYNKAIDAIIRELNKIKDEFSLGLHKKDTVEELERIIRSLPQEEEHKKWPVLPNPIKDFNRKGCVGMSGCPMTFMVIPPHGTTCSVCGEFRQGQIVTC